MNKPQRMERVGRMGRTGPVDNTAATWERDWRASVARQLADNAKQNQATAILLERLSNRFDEHEEDIKDATARIKALEERPERKRELAVSALGAKGQVWSAYIAVAAIVVALIEPWLQSHLIWH